MKVIDGELIEFSGNSEGRSGSVMKNIWGEVRHALEEKAKSYTLDTFIASQPGEMYHI